MDAHTAAQAKFHSSFIKKSVYLLICLIIFPSLLFSTMSWESLGKSGTIFELLQRTKNDSIKNQSKIFPNKIFLEDIQNITSLMSTVSVTTTSVSTTTSTAHPGEVFCNQTMNGSLSNLNQNPCKQTSCNIYFRDRGGRLGNRMFMFASAYGLARTHNCRLHITKEIMDELREHFLMADLEKHVSFSGDWVVSTTKIRQQWNGCAYIPSFLEVGALENFELTGFWQSYLYFHAYRDEIRTIFTAKPETVSRLANYLTKLMATECPSCVPLSNQSHQQLRESFRTNYNIIWIGIHIRRGDFVGIGFASANDYIHKAMRHHQNRYFGKDLRFIVASDDRNYCDGLFENEIKQRKVFVLPREFLVTDDLIALTLCHHSIITGGTFGFWSAYLAGGSVIVDNNHPVGCSQTEYLPASFLLTGPVKIRQR